MKKHTISYAYDNNNNEYVAACSEFVGFVIYSDDLSELKKLALNLLKIYTKDLTLGCKDVKFVDKTLAVEQTL